MGTYANSDLRGASHLPRPWVGPPDTVQNPGDRRDFRQCRLRPDLALVAPPGGVST